MAVSEEPGPSRRDRLHQIIFESDTPAGRAFDITLLVAIVVSVLSVVLESVGWINASIGPVLRAAEWGFTFLFTIEYLLRLAVVQRPLRYMVSFFAPVTPLGKLLASFVMALGYGIIAVPTGIVTVELAQTARASAISTQACPACGREGHDFDARHCKYCGAPL